MSRGVWEEPSRTLRMSAPYRALSQGLGEVVRLPLPAAAWVGELLVEDLGRPLLVVVPREADVLAWTEAAELFAQGSPGPVLHFPAPSLTPYQEADTSLHLRAQEAVALDGAAAGRARMVVTTPRALFRRLPDPRDFARAVRTLAVGEEHPPEELVGHLTTYGYHRTDLVAEVGELAVRGGVFDLFPPGEERPVRLELFGDEVESIRYFDPMTQRSEETVERVRVLPLLLFPAGPAQARELADRLEVQAGAAAGMAAAEAMAALRDRGRFTGWEHYLPWLAGAEASLAALLPEALVVAVDPETLAAEVAQHAERLAEDHASRRHHRQLALAPELLEHPAAAVRATLEGAAVRVGALVAGPGAAVDFAGSDTDRFEGQLPRFPHEVATARARGERCLLVAAEVHHERLQELLEARGVAIGRDGVELVAGDLGRGFRLPAAGVAVYGEQQILPRRAPLPKPSRRARYGPFIGGLRDLKAGDYVVHTDHGIGRFLGLRTVGDDGAARRRLPPEIRSLAPEVPSAEVMELEYAGGKSLLLPLERLDLIQKFSGMEGVAPRLDKLGGTSWNRTKSRVRASVRDMAKELLKLYAQRQVARAPAMPPETDLSRQFAAAFAYEESTDQLSAIAAIREDLEREQPMDRLLCGDVGYGKTEVAMRAAFKVVEGGFQVAVLAPTTILADQHLEVFKRRFEGFAVSIEMISRFRSPSEIRDIRERVAAGKVDVLVGTHRLLSKDIDFPRLGLLIVDEEQRFGVAQKERLKQLKKDVHVLAMSATPVPRTLQLSLAGVRDMSVIETPPKDRMAVETAIIPFSTELIREAVEMEMERGGQVYFVYNRVETIERMQSYLGEVVPGARITVGHGQLDEGELARRMHAFTAGDYDVLLATTIIENGIDIPNVNTMIVYRADRFGLAQLYQLRGRVGRSNQLAYCYLLVPGDRVLSEVARKRLAAIREFTDLGAGFRIAARDLEIRGAGNLLGAEQSGHIAAVGIETYLKMLEEAVRELKGEAVEEAPSAAIDLPVPMAIPQEYVADANLRMEIYRKIAAGEASDEELLDELTDRFGPPPPAVRTLLEVAALKRRAEALRVQSISTRRGELVLRLRRDAQVDVDRLIELVSSRPGASFSPTGVLTVAIDGAGVLATAREILDEVAAEPRETAAEGAAG